MKRGQLTIFILVAVVLVLIIIGVFLMFGYVRTPSGNGVGTVEEVRDFIYDCVDSTSKESLIVVSFQGGYYRQPNLVFSYSPTFFPYYYYEGQINLPTITGIESELGDYFSDRMVECLDSARFSNIDLSYSNPRTEVILTKDNVYFEIDMAVDLDSEGQMMTIDLRDFSVNHNSSLYEIYEVAEYITLTHEEDAEFYCMNCVSEMLYERDLYMYTFPTIVEDVTGVMIYENRTGVSDPYAFIFFNKYRGDEQTPKLTI